MFPSKRALARLIDFITEKLRKDGAEKDTEEFHWHFELDNFWMHNVLKQQQTQPSMQKVMERSLIRKMDDSTKSRTHSLNDRTINCYINQFRQNIHRMQKQLSKYTTEDSQRIASNNEQQLDL